MGKSLMVIALFTLLGSFSLAEPQKAKQVPNNSTVVYQKDKLLLKELKLDSASLNKLKFRLEKQRDIGPLLKSLGPGSTGGGDSCFQRIVGNYIRLVTGFKMGLLFNSDMGKNDEVLSALEGIEIQMGEDLNFNGHPVEALNIPKEHLVIVDRKVCKYQKDYEFDSRMMGLLLHEAYGVAEIKDQKYQESSKLLAKISTFSEGLGHGEDLTTWLVLAEFSRLAKSKNSKLTKLLAIENPVREKVNYTGLKIIKAGEYAEGRADDYGRPECDVFEKQGRKCSSDWRNVEKYYLIIINKEDSGSGWNESMPIYLEFKVEQSTATVVLDGNPETGERIEVPETPAKVYLNKIMNSK